MFNTNPCFFALFRCDAWRSDQLNVILRLFLSYRIRIDQARLLWLTLGDKLRDEDGLRKGSNTLKTNFSEVPRVF